MKRRKYGWDVYAIAILLITTHVAIIVAKFMGKDVGVSIPESLETISRQIEIVAVGYALFRGQKQDNCAHQRINSIQDKDCAVIKDAH